MNLTLTFDYELFGDGSGDVFEQMIKPTDQILNLCEKHHIKTTIFFEVAEYLKIKKEWESGNDMGYALNPVKAIDEQIKKALQSGHDIQLHIHPQWVHAEFTDNRWHVDFSNWRMGDFKSEKGPSLEELVISGKETLEGLLKEVDDSYSCIGFRAGAFNIMPSEKITEALKKAGIKYDSSVYPGGYEEGELSRYDYREVPVTKDYWRADPLDIRRESGRTDTIIEIPIFSLPKSRIYKLLNAEKIRSLILKKNDGISSVARTKIAEKNVMQKIAYLFQKEAMTWDFCLFSKQLHKQFFSEIENNLLDKRNTFVLIGHPKSLLSLKSLETLINLAKKSRYDYTFKTMKEIYGEFNT